MKRYFLFLGSALLSMSILLGLFSRLSIFIPFAPFLLLLFYSCSFFLWSLIFYLDTLFVITDTQSGSASLMSDSWSWLMFLTSSTTSRTTGRSSLGCTSATGDLFTSTTFLLIRPGKAYQQYACLHLMSHRVTTITLVLPCPMIKFEKDSIANIQDYLSGLWLHCWINAAMPPNNMLHILWLNQGIQWQNVC